MIFTVVWLPTAQDRLIELWLNALDRQAITKAANEIDRRLKNDAHLLGLSFFGGRIVAIPPLSVTFDVSMDDRLVTVAQVQLIH